LLEKGTGKNDTNLRPINPKFEYGTKGGQAGSFKKTPPHFNQKQYKTPLNYSQKSHETPLHFNQKKVIIPL
jgi:hypothetical protein